MNEFRHYGTLIARGWEHGHYPNRPAGSHAANSIVNHVGIFLRFVKPDKIEVLDQFVGKDGELKIRSYSVSEGWSRVEGTLPYERDPSDSWIS